MSKWLKAAVDELNVSRAATARGVALLRANGVLDGCHVPLMPEVSARVTKRQPAGRAVAARRLRPYSALDRNCHT